MPFWVFRRIYHAIHQTQRSHNSVHLQPSSINPEVVHRLTACGLWIPPHRAWSCRIQRSRRLWAASFSKIDQACVQVITRGLPADYHSQLLASCNMPLFPNDQPSLISLTCRMVRGRSRVRALGIEAIGFSPDGSRRVWPTRMLRPRRCQLLPTLHTKRCKQGRHWVRLH